MNSTRCLHAKKTFAALIEGMGGTVHGGTDFTREKSIERPGSSSTRWAARSSATTRRSRSATVEPDWDVKNLFLTDGGPFASNADKNPTLTIMALAWRAWDHMVDEAKKGNL